MEHLPSELGRFRIECELGRGGMGVVYRAFDPVVERQVAIKTIRCSHEAGAQSLERLRREARAVGSLEHSNIVTLYDAGDAEGIFYLVMQLVEGETLRTRMDHHGPFQSWEILDIFRQLLAALEYAHARGVIHRDVKPANVLITPEGTLKLTDFGVARLAGPGISTNGTVVGTPSYMAPEQILGQPVDGRCDIFAAGCVLYELVVGRKAFGGSSASGVMYQILHEAPRMLGGLDPAIRPSLAATILKALAKDPAERFATCAELRGALEMCLLDEVARPAPMPDPVESPQLETSPRAARAPVAFRRAIAVVAGGVLTTVAILLPAPVAAPSRDFRTEKIVQIPIRPPAPLEQPPPALPSPVPAVRRTAKAEQHRPPLLAPIPPASLIPSPSPADHDTFSSWTVRGDLAFQQENYRGALHCYQEALHLRPADGRVRRKVAVTLTLLGQPENARQYRR